jgi:HEAT repeat protein
MNRYAEVVNLSFFIFFLTAVLSPAHNQQTHPSNAPALIQQTQDANWETRKDAFDAILLGEPSLLANASRVPDNIKVALIQLLETENTFREKGVSFTEEYTEYYASVIGAVASLKDPRSVHGLMGAIKTGAMATDALAELGSVAVDPVIQASNSSDMHVRQAAAMVLSRFTEPKNLQNVTVLSRQKIKNALIQATRDELHYVRIEGIEGLAKLGDRDVVPLIQSLAAKDQFEGYGEQRGTYPVRKAAMEALKQLK